MGTLHRLRPRRLNGSARLISLQRLGRKTVLQVTDLRSQKLIPHARTQINTHGRSLDRFEFSSETDYERVYMYSLLRHARMHSMVPDILSVR